MGLTVSLMLSPSSTVSSGLCTKLLHETCPEALGSLGAVLDHTLRLKGLKSVIEKQRQFKQQLHL